MQQTQLSEILNVSQSHLSKIFSGAYQPGRKTCESFSKLTGRPWYEFLSLSPERIKFELEMAAKEAA